MAPSGLYARLCHAFLVNIIIIIIVVVVVTADSVWSEKL